MRYLTSAIVILALFVLLIGAVACSRHRNGGESTRTAPDAIGGPCAEAVADSETVGRAYAGAAKRRSLAPSAKGVDGRPPATGERWDQKAAPLADGTAPDDRDLGPGAGKERLGEKQGVAQPDPESLSGEAYAARADNPFVRASEPGGDASTFAIDVDTASYSNVRRYLVQNGQRPPAAAVRIEELINYFDYGYPAPAADAREPFAFATAVAPCPWAADHRLVRVAIKGRALDRVSRPPLNVVFLVDTSGSMDAPNRLPLVQRGMELLAQQLDARDHLAIVTYAGSSGTALPATSGADQARIRDVIRSFAAGGSTNGAGGIDAAYAEALKNAAPGAQSRVVLCTDGDFNVGTTGHDELKRLIEAKRATGVFLSVYGFGMGNLKDQTLEMLANAGNGVYGYIDDDREARKVMVDEALGALVTIAKDVKVQVFFNPTEVAGWRLIGFENRLLKREDFNDDRVDAGEIGAGHTVTALYEVVPAGVAVPAAAAADPNPFTDDYRGQLGIAPGTLMQLRLRWKTPAGEASALIERDVAATPAVMDDDFRFAAAVAGFGMLLRGSPYKGTCTWDLVQQLAVAGAARDPRGLRAEFIGLIGRARTP